MTEILSSKNADCSMVLTATTTADELQLHYRVTNTGEAVIYLCDQFRQLSEPSAATGESIHDLSPRMVHVQIDDQGVCIDKAIMDLSFHDGIKGLDIPFLTRLQPGQEHVQTLQIPQPLQPYRVQNSPPAEAAPTLLPMRFSLGYFVGSTQIEENITQETTSQGLLLCIASFMYKHQQIITIGPFHQPIPVANAIVGTSPHTTSAQQWTPWGP